MANRYWDRMIRVPETKLQKKSSCTTIRTVRNTPFFLPKLTFCRSTFTTFSLDR